MTIMRRRDRGANSGNYPLEMGKKRNRLHPNGVWSAKEIVKQSVPNDTIREITWDLLNPGPPFRGGGDFANVKYAPSSNELQGVGTYTTRPGASFPGSPVYEYTGGFCRAAMSMDGWLSVPGVTPFGTTTFPSLSSLGPTAYKLLKPRLEMAGLAVALGESRDLPRMLKTSATGFHEAWRSIGGGLGSLRSKESAMMRPKKLADHFLNHNFGWVPFLSDVAKIDDVLQNSRRYIKNLSDMNGEWVKRRRVHINTVQETLVSSEDVLFGSIPLLRPWDIHLETMVQPYTIGGLLRIARQEVRIVTSNYTWFEGVFKFYRPEFDRNIKGYGSMWTDLQRMQMLLGLRINPSTLYKATPWTWLIDWFAGVGDVVDNMTAIAEDQVASKYMYLMSHKVNTLRTTITVPFWDKTVVFVFDQMIETKQREMYDNPFGLALNVPLTARQISIMAALGISRK